MMYSLNYDTLCMYIEEGGVESAVRVHRTHPSGFRKVSTFYVTERCRARAGAFISSCISFT